MNGSIWYFCHLCDNYNKETGCLVVSSEEQENYANHKSCMWAKMQGVEVEMQKDYVKVNGVSFRKDSKDLAYVLSEINRLKRNP